MADDDRDNAVGVQPDGLHLIAQAVPATRSVPVEDITELFPAAVVQRDVPIRGLDDAHVHWQVDEGGVANVGLKCAVRHIQEPAALDDPCRILRPSLGALDIFKQTVGAFETLLDYLRRSLRPLAVVVVVILGE